MKKVILGERPVSRQLLMFLTLVTHLTISQGQSSRIYVNQHSSGSNTGESWLNAYPDLQHALNRAQYGDTIWVSEGTYKPTSTADRTISFELKNGVTLLGGFTGTEEFREQRDCKIYETVLSGDIGVVGDSLDNSYHVVYLLGADSTTLLEGFTITNGVANIVDPSYSSPFLLGGGLLLDTDETHPRANPQIKHCDFVNNSAWRGGGLYIHSSINTQAYPLIANCTFERNYAELDGGGLGKSGGQKFVPVSKLEKCRFNYNIAGNTGGGIYLNGDFIDIEIDSNVFIANESQDVGGGINFDLGQAAAKVKFNACVFKGNVGSSGGAIQMTIFAAETDETIEYQFDIKSSHFEQNEAKNDKGGAIANIVVAAISTLNIYNCSFVRNRSFNRGGAIQLQGTNVGENNLILESNYFAENVSSSGISGGIRIGSFNDAYTGDIKILNSYFLDNTGALTFLNNRGVISAEVYNNTFIRNGTIGPTIIKRWSPDFVPNIHWVQAEIANCIFSEIPERPLWFILNNNTLEEPSLFGYNFHHNLISAPACDLPGGEEACGVGNLFNVNPHFRDSLNGDFRLAGCSPAINAGVNNGLIGEFDLDGNPRILEDRVDMGAYEQATFDLVISTIQAAEVSCFGEGDGEVVVTTNGEAPLSYVWSQNGLIGAGNTGLEPGLYAMTVTDQQNCEESLFVQVDEPDSLMASFIAIPASIGQSDGYINLEQIQGGRQPYQWNWSTGATSSSVSGLPNGPYEVSVTDGNGCTRSWSFLLEAPDATLTPSDKAKLSISPNPLLNGQVLSISYQLEHGQHCQFKLINLLGQEVQHNTLRLAESGRVEWPIRLLPQGTYLLQVLGENGELLAIDRIVLVE